MDINPYQSPAPGSYATQAAAQPQVAVEGKALVLPSGMILPPISISNHRQGWFWVKGCCPEYLARIGAAPGTGQMG